MYITDDPTILIERNGHTSLEARVRYITDDPTICLHFAQKKTKKNREKEKNKIKGFKEGRYREKITQNKTTFLLRNLLG